MSDLPQPLTPAAKRHLDQLLRGEMRRAERALRESSAVLMAMYRDSLKGRRL